MTNLIKCKLTLVLPVIFGIIIFSSIIPVYAQDITQLMAEKYSLEVDEHTFDIYYGFKGSLEVDISDLEVDNPQASYMILNQEKKSLEIIFDEHEYAGPVWVRLPTEFMSAKGGEFQLLIDDVDKPYELTYYADDVSVGFFMPLGVQKVEIVGTSVIPEFSAMTVLVLGTGMTSLIILRQKLKI
jgi:hypothetical protein